MILDVTGVVLTPGQGGAMCLGNGEHRDKKGEWIPCCCDECDYFLCCYEGADCAHCDDPACPWAE